MANYPIPQRVWLRVAADKGLPALSDALRREIAVAVPTHDFGDGTKLWMVQFHWPTHAHLQDAIAAALAKLPKATTLTKRDDIPTTTISVQETVPDESKQPVDGVQPTKVVAVSRTLKEQAAKFGFVGEVRSLVDGMVAVEAVKK